MGKNTVKVIIRTRPTSNFASKNLRVDLEQKTIETFIPKDNTQGMINNQQENWKFKFDEILHNASQEEMFDVCSREIIQSVIEGYNGTLLAYGQTGAGKTFTMSGGGQSYKYRGIIPRTISQIFHEIQSKVEQAYTVRVSYVEIYNELLYDLLSTLPPSEQTGSISIQDDSKGGINVKGLSLNLCNTEEEALNYLFEGETNRTIAEHKLNTGSTRSHCIFTIHLESRSRVESSEKVVFSKLNLVDLAGSERTKKTGSEGLTLTEANYINKSLSYLEQVVIALGDKIRDHIPYRQSKLTHILKDSIGGNSKTLMISNIWPEPDHIEETISTLRFATRMMRVANNAIINIQLDPSQLIKRYEKEVRDLKQELAMHDTLSNRGRVNYEAYTPEQQYEMQKIAESYLDGQLEDIEFDSLRMVKEIFVQLKNVYKRTISRLGAPEYKVHTARTESSKRGASNLVEKQHVFEEDGGVGTEEKGAGFGLGKANPHARPADTTAIELRTNFVQDEEEDKAEVTYDSEDSRLSGQLGSKSRVSKPPPIDKNQAFMEFKNTEGRRLDEALTQNRSDLKDKKVLSRNLAVAVNTIKRDIDTISINLDSLRAQKPGEEEDVIDEEEYSMIKQLKDLKKTYREKYDDLKKIKDEVNNISLAIDQSKQKLIYDFEGWYGERLTSTQNVKSASRLPQIESTIHTAEMNRIEESDPDAMAYIRAKKNVDTIHKAKKQMATIKKGT